MGVCFACVAWCCCLMILCTGFVCGVGLMLSVAVACCWC